MAHSVIIVICLLFCRIIMTINHSFLLSNKLVEDWLASRLSCTQSTCLDLIIEMRSIVLFLSDNHYHSLMMEGVSLIIISVIDYWSQEERTRIYDKGRVFITSWIGHSQSDSAPFFLIVHLGWNVVCYLQRPP